MDGSVLEKRALPVTKKSNTADEIANETHFTMISTTSSGGDLPMIQIAPQDFAHEKIKKKRGRPRTVVTSCKTIQAIKSTSLENNDQENNNSHNNVDNTNDNDNDNNNNNNNNNEQNEETMNDIKGGKDGERRAQFVVSWLYQYYKASETTSVPRSIVFSKYLSDSTTANLRPVNQATFGKMIRAVFPGVRTRRLGTRGNSKYHYYGIAPAGFTGKEDGCVVEGEPRRKVRLPLRAEQHLRPPSISTKVAENSSIATDQSKSLLKGKETGGAFPMRLNNNPNQPSNISPSDTQSASHHQPTETAFHPLIPDFEEFARFVEQICQPVPEKLQGTTPLIMQAFSHLYQSHIVHMLKLISAREFQMVEMALGMFWGSIPQELWSCLHCTEGVRIISIADDYLFQVAIHILIPEVLEPLPLSIAQSIRHFAKSLDIWMSQVFDNSIPAPVVEAKIDIARRFCQVLRRRTALNHLSQAVCTILGSTEHLQAMLQDLASLDFHAIREQLYWIIPGNGEFVNYVEVSLRNYLYEGISIQQWSRWIEVLIDQCIISDLSSSLSLEGSARNFLLRWSFLTTLLMRDLTLRSSNSFGSYHLLRMFFDEYVMHWLEKKLDESRRALGLLSYWPTGNTLDNQQQPPQSQQQPPLPTLPPSTQQQQQQQQLPSQQQQPSQTPPNFGYENTMAGFTSMDDLFRKSGLLAYSQQHQ